MEEEEMMYMKFIEIKNLMKKRSNEFKPMTEKEITPTMKILKNKITASRHLKMGVFKE